VSRRVHAAGAAAAAALLLTAIPSLLTAQTTRDTLVMGRRAYERVNTSDAVRWLRRGLVGGGSARDTLWVGAVHMLTDALLEQGRDSLAFLWARWATRIAPGLRIDTIAYPPRVARLIRAARVTDTTTNDTLAATSWRALAQGDSLNGELRVAEGPPNLLAVVTGVGTMLPRERRTLPGGTYSVRFTAEGFEPLVVTREVLPGFATIIAPHLQRPGAVAAGPAPPPGPAGGVGAAAPSPVVVHGAALAAAGATTCTLRDHLTACWGNDALGQLGGGVTDASNKGPFFATAPDAFAALSVGVTHSCALTSGGQAWCWGLGTSGELGDGHSRSSNVPVRVAGDLSFVAIASGGAFSCALTALGSAWCWGSNRNGALGNRSGASVTAPAAVAMPADTRFVQIAAGAAHTCALAAGGALYCWGDNGSGQLGNGSAGGSAGAPTLIAAAGPFAAVTAGSAHTCALTTGGAAWCWGANASGQLGLGAIATQSERPAAVTGGLTFTTLVAGEAHTCGLTTDGAAYCWGAGRAGQLGNGQSADSPRPALVVGGQVFRSLALGTAHTCARAGDGATWCWGGNGEGQLGGLAGRAAARPVPFVVRPAPRAASAGAAARIVENFGEPTLPLGRGWAVDSARGARVAVVEGALDVSRAGGPGDLAGAGVTMPVRIPVTATTQIRFDVLVRADSLPCAINCATYPAVVRLRVHSTDLTESEVWYAFGTTASERRSLGPVVIVADSVPVGRWQRGRRFTIRDALPRADTIVQVSLGGIGTAFSARFDNLQLPVPEPATLTIVPDSIRITSTRQRRALRAVLRDATGAGVTDAPVRWSSSDRAVATVDSSGVVRAVANGRAVVRAVAGSAEDSVVVRVALAPARRRGRP